VRRCCPVPWRDTPRMARRLYRKPVADGVYRLDAGKLMDDFLHCLWALSVMELLVDVHGTARQRELVPFVQQPFD
jgi:hypothetical protein